MSEDVAALLAQGKDKDQIVAKLRKKGLSEPTALRFVERAMAGARTPAVVVQPQRTGSDAPVDEEKHGDGKWQMALGLFFLVMGGVGTAAGYWTAKPGGKYSVFYGAIAYGAFDAWRGLMRWYGGGNAGRPFPWAHVSVAGLLPMLFLGGILMFDKRILPRPARARSREAEPAPSLAPPVVPATLRTPPPDPALLQRQRMASLLQQIKAPSESDRTRAARGLGEESGAAEAIPALVEALRDASAVVRCEAASSLGRVDPDGQFSDRALREMLEDKASKVRVCGGAALAKRGASLGVLALVKELESVDAETRLLAARRLGEVGAGAAVASSALASQLRQDTLRENRMAYLKTLGQIGPGAAAAVPAISELSGDADMGLRVQANMTLTLIQAQR
jgi:hypothetical protein